MTRCLVFLLLLFCCHLNYGQNNYQDLSLPFQRGWDDEQYRAPLAGESVDIAIGNEIIHIPEHDRRNVLAVNMGSSFFAPKIGETHFVPFAALYYRRHWNNDRRRLRAVLSGLVNYIEFSEGSWNDNGWEFLALWENHTIPFPQSEIIQGREIEDSEVYWGLFLGSIGLSWRNAIYPNHCDNDFRLELYYSAGYLYIEDSENTGKEVILPPSTPIHELHFRLRYDTFDRNLLELPHRGWALGIDAKIGRRATWKDHQFADTVRFTRKDTRDYLRTTAYLISAFGLPFLSEKHRLLSFFHLGWSPHKNIDRFSAFRIGGGPNPSEANDLARHPFPGALFDQFLAENYLILTLEYRVEIFFFLFAHVRGTLAWARLAAIDEIGTVPTLTSETIHGQAFSFGITSGFLWESVIYIEYAYDNRVVRQKDSGHGVLISWSKAL